MFQEFPYTNFHQLNLDWIVKIAKDFLDQYTHIQEVIQTGLDDLAASRETGLEELNQKTLDGLADLQEKYDTLNGLLQDWYDTHSADIAGQLADAIADFNTAAEAKSQALIDSWPADYSELVTEYDYLTNTLVALEHSVDYISKDIQLNKCIVTNSSAAIIPENIQAEIGWCCLCVACEPGDIFYITGRGGNQTRLWAFSTSDGTRISQAAAAATAEDLCIVAPENAAYFAFNGNMTYTYAVFKGEQPKNIIQGIKNQVANENIRTLRTLTALKEYKFQYIDPSLNVASTIWEYINGKLVRSENDSNKTSVAYGVQPGTYKVSAYKKNWSYVENLLTGEVKDFNSLGLTGDPGNVTISYPHNVYISTSTNSTDVIWYDGTTLDNYAFGVHNEKYNTDKTLAIEYEIADSKEVGDRLSKKMSTVFEETIDRNLKAISKRWQFISSNASDWHDGTYNNMGGIDANAGYKCICVKGLLAGTYWINHFARSQTYIENIATGVFTSFYDLGYVSNTPTDFTVEYDFNIYISIQIGSNRQITTQALYNFNPNTLPAGFTDWNNIVIGYGAFDDLHIFHVGTGKEYTKLIDGINAAEKYLDSILFVDAGEYDLITELGSDYFSAFTGSGSYLDGAWGPVLKNRIHIIFAENANVICQYEGDNENVAQYFSAFNAGRYGFTLENANIDTSGIRYSVHDDRGNADEEMYCNKYLRCRIKHNSVGTQVTGYDQCIGGGFGNNGNILIRDCFFDASGYENPVSYHNSANGGTGYRAHCVFTGNYVLGGVRFNDTGASTDVTDVYVSNNSFDRAVAHGKTTPEAEDNVVVYEWNNVIRN